MTGVNPLDDRRRVVAASAAVRTAPGPWRARAGGPSGWPLAAAAGKDPRSACRPAPLLADGRKGGVGYLCPADHDHYLKAVAADARFSL